MAAQVGCRKDHIMRNEIRGFIFLALSVICFCTHQMCDKLWWIMAYIGGSWPNTGSILYGGATLFALAVIFLLLAVFFFLRAIKER